MHVKRSRKTSVPINLSRLKVKLYWMEKMFPRRFFGGFLMYEYEGFNITICIFKVIEKTRREIANWVN